MSKQPPPVPTASAVGPCPTVTKIVRRPEPGSLPRTIAPPDHPLENGALRKPVQGGMVSIAILGPVVRN